MIIHHSSWHVQVLGHSKPAANILKSGAWTNPFASARSCLRGPACLRPHEIIFSQPENCYARSGRDVAECTYLPNDHELAPNVRLHSPFQHGSTVWKVPNTTLL